MAFITTMPAPPMPYLQSFLEDMRKDSAKKNAKKAAKKDSESFWAKFKDFWMVNHKIRCHNHIKSNY